jgi:AbrB family looped-hinge helix DNA binding protein
MEVLQIRSNGQITLPASIRRQANLAEGDLLEIAIEPDGSLRLTPKVAVDRDQAYFWSERWQQGEQEADDDLRTGRYADFETMDEFIKSLRDAAEIEG